MSTHSSYFANEILNVLKGTAPATITSVFLALFVGDPESGGTECTTTIRTAGRPALTLGTVASKTVANSAACDFGNAAGGQTGITHFAVYDAASAGNRLMSATLTGQPIAVSSGTDFDFAIGAITLTE